MQTTRRIVLGVIAPLLLAPGGCTSLTGAQRDASGASETAGASPFDLERLPEQFESSWKTLIGKGVNPQKARVLLMLALLVALPMVGIDLTMLSVFGGALGVGLGFGLQKIAANYVSGFIILLDRSIRIGNMIAVGTERGVVTRITTRYTLLLARNGIEKIVPNEMLIGSVIANETHTDPQVRVPLQVQVAYGSDLRQVQRIMIDAALSQRRVLTEPPPRAHVAAFADSGVDFELRFWIGDPENGIMQIKSDIHLAIWDAFTAAGIQIPFPQREVRLLQ